MKIKALCRDPGLDGNFCVTPLGVSMDIYEGHVTALLGHNGAGKTTLIAMMTGMVPATEGYATVYGKDITDPSQMQEIRKGIGENAN